MSKSIKDILVDIRMKEGVKDFVHKPYTVPYSLRAQVEDEIDISERSLITSEILL